MFIQSQFVAYTAACIIKSNRGNTFLGVKDLRLFKLMKSNIIFFAWVICGVLYDRKSVVKETTITALNENSQFHK